jgi:hypothetical protein
MGSPMAGAEFEEPLRTIVRKRHHATDSSQLELHLNDIVMVLEKDETGWWGGHKEGDEQTGWFPGFCVQPCPLAESEIEPDQELSTDRQSEPLRNPALDTEVPSPERRVHAVASPQRRGIPASSSVARNETEAYRCQEELLQEKSQQCVQLDSEVTKLKRDKETLEEALRQAQRQSSLEREERSKMEHKITEVERRLQAESSERKATHLKCEQLVEELRHKDEEVATLRRMSVASAMMTQSFTPNTAAPAQSPSQQASVAAKDEGPRRRLFPSVPNNTSTLNNNTSTLNNTTELNSTNLVRSPSPQPVASATSFAATGGCSASAREDLCSSRRTGEEPPVGYVKQLRNAFEARSVTPQRADNRAESRTRGRSQNASRDRTMNTTVGGTTAASKGGSQCSQIPRPGAHGISSGLAISTEAAPEEIVYGMSPINSSNKKDLKRGFA